MSLKSVMVRGSELVCIKYKGVGNLARCRFMLVDVPLLTQLWIQAKPRLSDLIAMLDMFDPVVVAELCDRDKIHNSYSQIKEVEFVGYRGVSNQFQMIKQFIEYGTALDKVIVDPRSFKHKWHMPWDRIYRIRNHMEDEIFVRNRARDQFKDSRINITIL
ncbi:hypothetical protein SASPL_149278 [Salvia splendens]|uniref:Uncharacterized protein n=1 Tax=Salvia splendens TaxID=180675 RepID=A0A8X8WAU6_SALSN|nr:hypothetical protein SASPL_149278 [Salvia splendens]